MSETAVEGKGLTMDGKLRSSFLDILFDKIGGDNGLTKCCAVRALEGLGSAGERSLEALLLALGDDDPDVRVDAAAALGRLGQTKAVPDLLDHLKRDGEGDVRTQAARALGSAVNEQTLPALFACILAEGYPDLDPVVDDYEYSPAWDVQAEALESVGRIGDPAAAAALVTLLRDPENDHLIEAGFRILGRMKSDAGHEFLLEALQEGPDKSRTRAARSLGLALEKEAGAELTSRIEGALVAALGDRSATVRIAAAMALSDLDEKISVTPLTTLLTDSDIEVRLAVIVLLARFTGDAVRLHLELMLKDPRIKIKRAATRALGKLGDSASGEALGGLVTTSDDRLAFDVIEALGVLGGHEHCQALLSLLNDTMRNRDIRMEAAAALGAILTRSGEEEGLDSAAGLANIVGGPDISLASAALTALHAGAPSIAEELVVSLFADTGDEKESVAQESAEPEETTYEVPDPSTSTLGAILVRSHFDTQIANKAKRVIAKDDPQRRLKLLGLRLLGTRDTPGTGAWLEILAGLLSSQDAEFRKAAVLGLGARDVTGVDDIILTALEDSDAHIRIVALESLVGKELDRTAQEKVFALSRDPDPQARALVVLLLGSMDREVQRSVLGPGLKDGSEMVCKGAVQALCQGELLDENRTALIELSRQYSGNLRFDIGRALGRMKDERSVAAFLDALKDPDEEEFHWICMDVLAAAFSTRGSIADAIV